MPSLETPVLTVDANTIHRIDTRNVSNTLAAIPTGLFTNILCAGRKPLQYMDPVLPMLGLNRGGTSLGKPELEVVE
jgi:hypothetical protein